MSRAKWNSAVTNRNESGDDQYIRAILQICNKTKFVTMVKMGPKAGVQETARIAEQYYSSMRL
jgi:hypothetical protein